MATVKIFDAADRNDLDKVKMFIEKGGVSPTVKNDSRQTLAHIAVKKGYLDLLKYVLEKDPPLLNIKYYGSITKGPCTVLDMAVEHGNLEVVKYLVENQNADIYEVFHETCTAINWAVCCGHLNITKYFIEERNVDVNKPPIKGRLIFPEYFRPLLFYAVEYGRKDIITYLIEERKADLTVVDKKSKQNILFPILQKGDLDLMKYILDEKKARIDINWKNEYGNSLVYSAVINSRMLADNAVETLRYLIGEKHADFDISVGQEKRTLLHLAADSACLPQINVTQYLIECGAEVGRQDINGDTALHLAVSGSFGYRHEISKRLLKYGANMNQKNNKNETPFDIVLEKLTEESEFDWEKARRIELCKLLIENGASVNSTDKTGNQLVHIAAIRNLMSLLDYLVRDKQVDVNAPRETDNWTPLHCAAMFDNFRICKYLIEHGADFRAKSKCGKIPAQLASDQYVIDYLGEVSATNRSRRSVEMYSSTLLQNPKYHEYNYRMIAGSVNGSKMSSSGSGSILDFLSNVNFFMRYFVKKRPVNSPRDQGLSFRSPATLLQSRMDPVAENAAHNFFSI